MADFKTHIAGSSLLGIAYGGVAYATYDVPASTCILAAGLCSVSGMLPDIDSGPGRPLREISLFLAAIVPTMLFDRFQRVGMSPESIILIGAAVYVAIRFGLVRLLKRVTVHRGMFHSLPAAIIFGELAFLLASGDDTLLRWYKAGAVVLGYVCHLVLDELFSVQWNGIPRVKKSFGTALKIVGRGWWPNLSTYAKLAVLTLVVIEEPGVMRDLHNGQMEQVLGQISRQLPEMPLFRTAQPETARPGDPVRR